VELARTAAEEYLGDQRKVHVGTIASGDQFIAHPEKLEELRTSIPDLLCVEMEGAAVAQVCHEYGVPFLVIRTISDKADHSAPVDFMSFIEETAKEYSYGILRKLVPKVLFLRKGEP
jgi:adenosylhomocysteine nucleosidase